MTIYLDMIQSLALATGLLFFGKFVKRRIHFFQKLRVWAAPIKIFRYNKLLCTDSLLSVCVKQNLKKQAVAVVNGNAKNIGNALRCL